MPDWGIAQTESRREHVAARFLEQQAFNVYYPRIMTTRARVVPLFPGYLFFEMCEWIDERWWDVHRTAGVVRVFMQNDCPARVPEKTVEALHESEVNGLVKLASKPMPRPLGKGDLVRVLCGSLAGQTGIYQGMSGSQRSRILLNLLGREVKTVVKRVDLVRIEQG